MALFDEDSIPERANKLSINFLIGEANVESRKNYLPAVHPTSSNEEIKGDKLRYKDCDEIMW